MVQRAFLDTSALTTGHFAPDLMAAQARYEASGRLALRPARERAATAASRGRAESAPPARAAPALKTASALPPPPPPARATAPTAARMPAAPAAAAPPSASAAGAGAGAVPAPPRLSFATRRGSALRDPNAKPARQADGTRRRVQLDTTATAELPVASADATRPSPPPGSAQPAARGAASGAAGGEAEAAQAQRRKDRLSVASQAVARAAVAGGKAVGGKVKDVFGNPAGTALAAGGDGVRRSRLALGGAAPRERRPSRLAVLLAPPKRTIAAGEAAISVLADAPHEERADRSLPTFWPSRMADAMLAVVQGPQLGEPLAEAQLASDLFVRPEGPMAWLFGSDVAGAVPQPAAAPPGSAMAKAVDAARVRAAAAALQKPPQQRGCGCGSPTRRLDVGRQAAQPPAVARGKSSRGAPKGDVYSGPRAGLASAAAARERAARGGRPAGASVTPPRARRGFSFSPPGMRGSFSAKGAGGTRRRAEPVGLRRESTPIAACAARSIEI